MCFSVFSHFIICFVLEMTEHLWNAHYKGGNKAQTGWENLRVKNAQTADFQAPPKGVSQGGHADQSPRANTPSFVGDHNASDTNRRKKQEGSQTHSGSCRSNPELTQGQAGHVQAVTSIKKEAPSRYKFLFFMYFFISDIHEA